MTKFKVVDFKVTKTPGEELKKIIQNEEHNGSYKYLTHQYSDKMYPGTSGCFGIGAKPPSTDHVGFVIFRKIDE